MALDQLPSVLTTPFWVLTFNAMTHVKVWELFLLKISRGLSKPELFSERLTAL